MDDFSLTEVRYDYLGYRGGCHASRLDRWYLQWRDAYSVGYSVRAIPVAVARARTACVADHAPVRLEWNPAHSGQRLALSPDKFVDHPDYWSGTGKKRIRKTKTKQKRTIIINYHNERTKGF